LAERVKEFRWSRAKKVPSSLSFDQAGKASRRQGADGIDAADRIADLLRQGLPPHKQVWGVGLQEPAVAGQTKGGSKEDFRDRLGAPDSTLEAILLAPSETFRQESSLVDGPFFLRQGISNYAI
jgi:hypothetical protein